MKSQDSHWQIIPDMVVRHAGFAFDRLTALRMNKTANELDVLVALELEREQLKAKLLATGFVSAVDRVKNDKAELKRLSRARTKVGRGTFDRMALAAWGDSQSDEEFAEQLSAFAQLTEQIRDAQRIAQDAFESERPLTTQTIRQLYAEDPWLAEAIYISNPDLYEKSFKRLVEGRERRKAQERRLALYLHRFCAKNETASFFGPMNYGVFNADHKEPVRIRKNGKKLSERRVYYSFWMVEALAKTIAADPKVSAGLPVRLHPLLVLQTEGDAPSASFAGTPLKLPARVLEAFQQVETCSSLEELRKAIGDERLLDKILGRFVLAEISLPSTVFNPMATLEQMLREMPLESGARETWLPVLSHLNVELERLAGADVDTRAHITREIEQFFTKVTGVEARRKGGETYADRTLMYEECSGTLDEFSFNTSFTEQMMERLQPVLKLLTIYGHVGHRSNLERARLAFDQIAEGRTRIPYLEFISGIDALENSGALPDAGADVRGFLAQLSALVKERQQDGVSRLRAEDFTQFAHLDTGLAVHTSPDLMLCAPTQQDLSDGRYQIVMGEVHQFLAMWGSQFLFHHDAKSVRRRVEDHIGQLDGYGNLATVLNARRHKGLINDGFPGTFIELTGLAGEGTDRVAIRDLDVVRIAETTDPVLHLVSRKDGRQFNLYHAGDDKLHLWAFSVPPLAAPPVRFEGYTPRILVGDVVFQRARWEVTRKELLDNLHEPNELQIMLALRRVCRRNGIPNLSFVRVPSEKKPLFLDLDNVNACASVIQALGEDERLTFVEMLPNDKELWLSDAEGSYSVEIRGTCVRPRVETGLAS
ncbi:lantibiotic dehydratase [Pseudovibrio exalbescens]|nr:lantibiotic dehydratase [Pseudovibrio exalbescens]